MSNYYDYWSPKGSSYGKWMLQHVDQIWYRNDQTIRDQPSCFYILNCDTTSYVDTSRTLRRNYTLRVANDQLCWEWESKESPLENTAYDAVWVLQGLYDVYNWCVLHTVSIVHAMEGRETHSYTSGQTKFAETGHGCCRICGDVQLW